MKNAINLETLHEAILNIYSLINCTGTGMIQYTVHDVRSLDSNFRSCCS